jgi:hypothetical protein
MDLLCLDHGKLLGDTALTRSDDRWMGRLRARDVGAVSASRPDVSLEMASSALAD